MQPEIGEDYCHSPH